MDAMQGNGDGRAQAAPLLAVVANLARYHREHEKYYAEAPLVDAIALLRSARTLIALAERWTTVSPEEQPQRVDFSPAALRADLRGPRTAPGYLCSAAELINHAADLSATSAILVHENERRWRVFAQRVQEITRDRPRAQAAGVP